MTNKHESDLQGTKLEKFNSQDTTREKKIVNLQSKTTKLNNSKGAGTPLDVKSSFENIKDVSIKRSASTESLKKAMEALQKAKSGNFSEDATKKQTASKKKKKKPAANQPKQGEKSNQSVKEPQAAPSNQPKQKAKKQNQPKQNQPKQNQPNQNQPNQPKQKQAAQNQQNQNQQKPAAKKQNQPKQKNKNTSKQNTQNVQNKQKLEMGVAAQPKQAAKSNVVNVTAKSESNQNAKSSKNAVKIHFIGGIGEIGKNCTAIECGEDIIVIDGGMSFPTEEMPGIDVVIPDTTFLQQNRDRVRAFLITHGHEDHIGALPYILKDINVPLYGSKLTFAILENKLKEKNVSATTNVIKGGDVISIGKFKIEFIHVNHSIPGSLALSITTPQGVIFHTGDFKIDFSPVDGQVMDLARIAEIGKKGVQVLLADSTNSEKDGYVMSESTVGSSLLKLFEENEDKRIIVATFASNVHRVQQIIDVAKKTKRKVALSGRSMINVVDAAMRIGAINADENTFVDIDKIDKLFDRELVIISTGSQGEPMSALARMSAGDFNKVKITKNDAVIISASPIPGNEKMVYRVVNRLMKLGAHVIYSKLHEIHVSGHAAREELKIIHELTKPKLFIPVHGEYRHLISHKNLAIKQGMQESKILVPELGDSIEITKNAAKRVGQIPHGAVLVDGLGFGDMDSLMLKDRKLLSEEGVVIAVVAVNTISGELLDDPEIVIRGIVLSDSKDKLLMDAKKIILQVIRDHDLKDESSRQDLKFEIRKKLRNFFLKIKQRPMILPIVIEAKKDISISRDDIRIDGM